MSILKTIEIETGAWTADASHSEVSFSVKHAGISKVKGSFDKFSVNAEISEKIEDTKITAEVETNSINTKNADRDAHLTSADFFDSENFKNMTFKSAGITETEDGLKLHGDLEIRGVSRCAEFDVDFGGVAVDPFGVKRMGLDATTTISRKDFGLTWNAVLEAGGVLVSDKVKINLDLSFIKA